jgi:hypothetical protein
VKPEDTTALFRYRAYLLDDWGVLSNGSTLFCDSDEQAVALATLLSDGYAVEVWDGDRLVQRLPAKPRHAEQMAG